MVWLRANEATVRLKSMSLFPAVVPRGYGLAKISMSMSVLRCDLRETLRNRALLPDRDMPEILLSDESGRSLPL
jgi:hypothetical protein